MVTPRKKKTTSKFIELVKYKPRPFVFCNSVLSTSFEKFCKLLVNLQFSLMRGKGKINKG